MHIYLDEAGSFSGFHPGSISAVGALAIPHSKIEFIKKKYAKIRRHLPVEKGEVKGRSRDERQVNEVTALLARNEAVFEITVIDLGVQTEAEVIAYKEAHARGMLARVHLFHETVRQSVESACRQILVTSVPLYLQAIATFEVLQSVINHIPLFLLNGGRKIWEPSHGSSTVKIDLRLRTGSCGGHCMPKARSQRCPRGDRVLKWMALTIPILIGSALLRTTAQRELIASYC